MSSNRFAFGKNWQKYILGTTEQHVDYSKEGIRRLLKRADLADQTFLDIGCGSGMSSVAAHRLGAKVTSFDYDRDSCRASQALFEKFNVKDVKLSEGSAIDPKFMRSLPTYDIVYSWGVLHHTGEMWRGLELASERVAKNGICAVAIYNDQGGASKRWLWVKRTFVALPSFLRIPYCLLFLAYFEGRTALSKLVRLRNPVPFADWKARKEDRGMSVWTDLVDWVGGYPFEVAKPEEVFEFFTERGFQLEYLKTCAGGLGCNEFMFRKLS